MESESVSAFDSFRKVPSPKLIVALAIAVFLSGVLTLHGSESALHAQDEPDLLYEIPFRCVPEIGPQVFTRALTFVSVSNPGDEVAPLSQWLTTRPFNPNNSFVTDKVSHDLAAQDSYRVYCSNVRDLIGLPDSIVTLGGNASLSIKTNHELAVFALHVTFRLGAPIDISLERIEPEIVPIDVPTPLTASASIMESNSLIAQIEGTVDMPGQIFVEYQLIPGGDVFRSQTTSTDGTNYIANVVRLRAESFYGFTVFGTNVDGETIEGPTGIFETRPLPVELQGVVFNFVSGQPTNSITLMDMNIELDDRHFGSIVGIDGTGEIVWYYLPEEHGVGAIAQKQNGNILYTQSDTGAVSGFGIREITPLGEIVDGILETTCLPESTNGPWHHELQVLPNDRVLFLSRDIQEFAELDFAQEGDTFAIWDQSAGPFNGSVSEVWNIFDWVDPRVDRGVDSDTTEGLHWRSCSGEETVQDWTHGNSVMLAPDESYYLYSSRHLDQLISVAPDFQSINWRLGGPGGDFTFQDPNDRFYHQHSATPIDNPDPDKVNVLLFDNGNLRPVEEGGEYSRALELELDLVNMTARKVWEYRHDPDLLALCCSNVTRLENGNTVLVFGADLFAPQFGKFTIVEADSDGNVVWVVEEPAPTGKIVQYRVYPRESIMGEVIISGP